MLTSGRYVFKMSAVQAPECGSPEACLEKRRRDRGLVPAFQISERVIEQPLFHIQGCEEQGKQHGEAKQDDGDCKR